MTAARPTCLLDTLLAAECESKEPGGLSEETRQGVDMAMHQFKQPLPGNPLVDGYEAARQAKAIAIERGSRRFS